MNSPTGASGLSTTFHPLVATWFEQSFGSATEVQERGWNSIAAGEDTLVAAPTGSGKTLAAFLWALDGLVREAATGSIEDRIHVVYVSPLKALGNDIEKNLRVPLSGISELAATQGVNLPEIRAAVRSGDTPARDRRAMIKRPPHILITTPESLYILLTAEKSREALRSARTVIVDEIHAVAEDKRGAHLAVSLERLDALTDAPLQRIGLSATQKPIEDVAGLLVGAARKRPDGKPACTIVDVGHRRHLDLSIAIPDFELGPISSHELQGAVYDRIAELVEEHRTTIVFVNTRRLVERVAQSLSDRLGKDKVAAHHGSLSKETRLMAEMGLKAGDYPVVVATASLELGIDVGHVDLVCHLGAPRALATLLQRVGRSGHFIGAIPKGVFFPLTRDDLLQCAAAVRSVYAGDLDRLIIPENPLDILAQQIVATVAAEEQDVEGLWTLLRGAYPFRNLPREDFDACIEMLAEGVSTRRGRRAAHLHFDRVGNRLRPRRGARLAAIMSGGAIPDTADYDVVAEPDAIFVGRVNEDFAIESMAGDIFQLGNHSWRILRVEGGRMRVEDAGGLPPTIPFWLGESPGRTIELSEAVADLRREIAERRHDPKAAQRWIVENTRVSEDAAVQMLRYIDEAMTVLGAVPTTDTVIAERFFDEAGGMQLVIHAPFGARINRALGLSLRKRFCVSFDFELQAAATDDGVVLSLGEQHSFPLENVFSMVRSSKFEEDLVQAALASPMFTNRWRWNATRSLTLLRHNGGKRVPIAIQRMRAEDLMAAVFPEQLGCQDNRMGNIAPPKHPLVDETVDNCLHEAMDSDGLRAVLADIESGAIRTLAVDTPAPSVLSHELLNANPYAFLDDAPLEERRARAVSLRRTDPNLASGIGALDASAIQEVRRQAWPDARDPDEVHDVMVSLVVLPESHAGAWSASIAHLIESRRAVRAMIPCTAKDEHRPSSASASASAEPVSPGEELVLGLVTPERVPLVRALYPRVRFVPAPVELAVPSRFRSGGVPENSVPENRAIENSGGAKDSIRKDGVPGDHEVDADVATVELVRGWLDCLGPVTAAALATRVHLPKLRIEAGLARLEAQGAALQGSFTDEAVGEVEWCERGLLARIHRMTLGRLRQEIKPVSAADYMRFLFRWQHVHEGSQLVGRDGVRHLIGQLGGLELPGPAWETSVLPARIKDYDPADLEQLCLAGEVGWARLGISIAEESEGTNERRRRRSPTRSAPLAFFLREDLDDLLEPLPDNLPEDRGLSPISLEVLGHLEQRGACFLADIGRDLGRLPTEVEDALWELVAAGFVTGDGVAGLRTLLLPEEKRRRTRRSTHHLRGLPSSRARRSMPIGRWSVLRTRSESTAASREPRDEEATRFALRLLDRYGILFRDLCARERRMPRWRELLWALRRLEAQGQVRGGRFVEGFTGEQFALPHAVDTLRNVRRAKDTDEIVLVAAADPLNLVGIIGPGARISPFSTSVVAYRNGVAIETGELGEVRSRLQTITPPREAGAAPLYRRRRRVD